ncbi:hypothetical protein SAE02_74860 [Skermanella aerolata]|uniref:histidine kinase n=1 Tax=Skermanella aerolata TaxID=393310 RepID=A0A512E3P4_9PROT|nr:ATP-binding protein [Skermanella aerolata]KJB90413.1 hypothetical protein N826_41280 [Skermanella aerolata KACC 11604]GEO43338.1 hypothetical protein SAE02_74860 [Skermanella aerolata]
MRLAHKFLLTNALIAGFGGVVAWQGYQGMRTTEVEYSRVVRETLPVVRALEELRFSALRIVSSTSEFGFVAALRRSAREYSDTDKQEDHEEDLIGQAEESYRDGFQHYSELMKASLQEENELRARLWTGSRALLSTSADIRSLLVAGAPPEALLEAKARLEADEEHLLDLLRDAIAAEEVELLRREENVHAAILAGQRVLGLTALLVLTAAMVASCLVSRSIAIPLSHLAGAADEITRGRFTGPDLPAARGEVGQLVSAFNTMTAALRHSTAEREQAQASLHQLNLALETRVDQRTAELRDTQEELLRAERLAVLGQLTATVAHELRNPLSAIRNTVFVVRETANRQGFSLDRPIARIDRSIERCNRIISDLLDFSRSGEPRPEPRLVGAWLDEVLAEQCLPDGVTLRAELAEADVVVDFDPDQMRQVIINLLENAAQAITSPPGEPESAPPILVRTRLRGGSLDIVIEDGGSGIGADILPRVFEPLFSTRSFGTGLGLPTVKRIVERHGGSITIASAPGEGTQVTVTLPVLQEVAVA